MAKKGTTRRKGSNRKGEHIDMIPKLSQQPRSSPPKRRTDFSLFFTYPESPTNIAMAMSCLDDSNEDKTKHLANSPTVSTEFEDSRLQLSSNASRGSNEPVTYEASLNPPSDSSFDEQNKDTAKNSGVCVDPGSVVWAKTADQTWWPGEIMGESSMFEDSNHQGTNGHVRVQFYGKNQIALVDPARDLAQLEDTLNRKEQLSSSELLCKSNDSNDSSQHDRSYGTDKWSSSMSIWSRVGDEDRERGRGKREKKPKVHFDEVVFSPKSSRQLRRLRIMRNLGLAAPVGSPF